MIFTMFVISLIPASGFKASTSDIRIEYTHTHDHHEHEANAALTDCEEPSHTEKHSHELVISMAALTFIASKNILSFVFNQPAFGYPSIQDDKLPLSHFLNSIFRPPISA